MAEMSAMARENGVEFVLVDGAQSVGMIPLDLSTSGVDAFATSPHKWVQSVKGLGLFFLHPDLLDRVRPFWVTWGLERWRGTARAFEDYGTRDLPEVLSLGDALDFQRTLGEDRKERAYQRVFHSFMEKVDATPGLTWRSPRIWERGSILAAVGLERQSAGEVSESLYADHGIVVRPFPAPGLNSLRVSPNLMTEEKELDRLLELLAR
jgi:L-cysteine/cystine lyase